MALLIMYILQMGRLRLQMEPWQMMEKKQEEDKDQAATVVT